MTEDRCTMEQFITAHKLTMAVAPTDIAALTDMPEGSHHWSCMIHGPNGVMVVPFSMGPGLSGEPVLVDVLECLASDAASFDSAEDVWDFLQEFGYEATKDTFATYEACGRLAHELAALLGEGPYKTLLYEVGR